MTATSPVGELALADAAIVDEWVDAFGARRVLSASARAATLAAMLGPASSSPPDPIVLCRPGQALPWPADLVLEDGTELGTVSTIPRGTPIGYHRLRDEAAERLCLVPPARCPLPPGYRAWAWAVQLYAARSRQSWGIGDAADLRSIAAWSAGIGAGALLLSPSGAPNPAPQPEPSPYYPSTRRYRDPLLLRIEEVPGAGSASLAATMEPLARAGRGLNAVRRIDRGEVLRLKRAALAAIWETGAWRSAGAERAVAAYRQREGTALQQWAVFAALSEALGPGWQRWPEAYRRPDSAAVARFTAEHPDDVAFHAWVQWLVDDQLAAAAAAGPRLLDDLPVGFDPGGFDAWAWQDVLAPGASIGAPPDLFNPTGQNWGLPPFVPHRLRAAWLGPFRETVSAVLRHAGGLRIDHVLGLFRLWWVPAGAAPDGGAYVRYPADELLAVLAIESQRAGAIIVGEDLGTVEAGVRRKLDAAGLLGMRLVYFERRPPADYPRRVLVSLTTHDLPTAAGTWLGADAEDVRSAGVPADLRRLSGLRTRMARAAGVAADAPLAEAIVGVYRALARSPACLVSATLEDALQVVERPNLPGTDARQRPNWSLALPRPIEELPDDPFVTTLAGVLRR